MNLFKFTYNVQNKKYRKINPKPKTSNLCYDKLHYSYIYYITYINLLNNKLAIIQNLNYKKP